MLDLHKATLVNVGPFANFTLDLDALGDAVVVALSGDNGKGKSLLLEAAGPGSMYRRMPTQGMLKDRVHGDASLEVECSHEGQRFKLRHLFGESGQKSQALLLAGDKWIETHTGTNVTRFFKWAERNLPPEDLFLTAQFQAQRSRGFIALGSADRISIILHAKGLDRFERMAKIAGDKARETSKELDSQRKILEALGTEELRAILRELELAESEAEDLTESSRRAELEDLRLEWERYVPANERYVAARTASETLLRDAERAEQERVDALRKLDGAQEAKRKSVHETEEAEAKLREATERECAAKKAEELRREETRRYEIEDREWRAAKKTHDDLKARADDLEGRIRNNETLEGERAAIESATKRVSEIPAERERKQGDVRALKQEIERGRQDRKRQIEQIDRELEDLRPAVAQLAAAREALAALPAAREGMAERARALAAARAELDEHVANLGTRVGGLRTGLQTIVESEQTDAAGLRRGARTALDADDVLLSKRPASEEREHHRALAEAVRKCEEELAVDQELVSICEDNSAGIEQLEQRATKIPELEQLRGQIARETDQDLASRVAILEAEDGNLADELERARKLAAKAEKLAQTTERIRVHTEALEQLRPELAAAADAWAKLGAAPLPLEFGYEGSPIHVARARAEVVAAGDRVVLVVQQKGAAEALVQELEPRIEPAREAAARARRAASDALEALPNPPSKPALPLEDVKTELEELRKRELASAEAVASARQKAKGAREREEQRETTRKRIAELTERFSDWTRLAQDFGRKGIQSEEVDAAGPEMTALANDYLRSCHGPRWSVEVTTRRTNDKGEEIDECQVMVYDAEDGSKREGLEHSGGEQVLVGKPLDLALLMMGKASARGATLILDESGAALDPKNAKAYVAMLRRCAAQIGAKRVLFIAHDEAVKKLADARIEIGATT